MPIYDEERMKQQPVYPTKQTPSYADWRLFQMGKELEESISGDPNNFTFDREIKLSSIEINTNEMYAVTVDNLDADKSYMIYIGTDTPLYSVQGEYKPLQNATTYKFYVENKGPYRSIGEILILLYSRNESNTRFVINNGTLGGQSMYLPHYTSEDNDKMVKLVNGVPVWSVLNVRELPPYTSGDANKVLRINNNGEPVWYGLTVVPVLRTYTYLREVAMACYNNRASIVTYHDENYDVLFNYKVIDNNSFMGMRIIIYYIDATNFKQYYGTLDISVSDTSVRTQTITLNCLNDNGATSMQYTVSASYFYFTTF